MRFKTATGAILEVGCVPRRVIDSYIVANPPPDPPQITVEVFGGATETIDDRDNPVYLARVAEYNLRMAHEEFAMISRAVTLVAPENWEQDPRVAELATLGIPITDITEYLRYIALSEDGDLAQVTGEVLYLSTVTQRGIIEAEKAFAVTYLGAPLSQHPNPPSTFQLSALYQARLAATQLGYTWERFCELTGPEQSAVVAQYQCTAKVQWLAEREQEQKIRHQSHSAKGRLR